jgi:DNA-binding transcriptional ArsR family regulator
MDNNLHYMRSEPPLVAPVFRSEAQARLLSSILLAGDELSLTELALRTDTPYATAHREVARLLDAGILTERTVGRTRLISANPESPLVAPLREILAIVTGPVVFLTGELSAIANIEAAFLYGSYAARSTGVAGPPPGDIDLMVVGTPDRDAIYDACDRVERLVGRPVNPTIMTIAEAQAESQSGFMKTVTSRPTVPLIGVWP